MTADGATQLPALAARPGLTNEATLRRRTPSYDLVVRPDGAVSADLDGGGPQGEQVTGSAGPAARRLGGGREQDNRERGPDGYQLRRAACRVSLLDQGTVASRDGAGGPRQNPAHGAPDAAPAQRRRS